MKHPTNRPFPPARKNLLSRLTGLGAVYLLVTCSTAWAQNNTAAQKFQPVVTDDTNQRSGAKQLLSGWYAAAVSIGQLEVSVAVAGKPADGVSLVPVTLRVMDRRGEPMAKPAVVTVETGGARLQMSARMAQQLGKSINSDLDIDPLTPGIQLLVQNGVTTFDVVAPSKPTDVVMRFTAGQAEASGSISFGPDLRQMVASGLIEGIIKITQRQYSASVSPVIANDGFEQQLTQWSKSVGGDNQNRQVALRAAGFVKGKIRGDALLTLAYDSDKETRSRLLSSIRPEEFYPVYGDASVKGFEAQSSAKLYVRVEKGRNFVLFGDFDTRLGYTQAANNATVAGTPLRQLGAYSRALTGVQTHAENAHGSVSAFVSQDTLKDLTEELRGNGTSGPFALNNTAVLENSERIEIITRDRSDLSRVTSVVALVRMTDYSFEPFSGRILLARPLPSQDAQGNPMSLRIHYELDQGGVPFWVAGVEGQANLNANITVGASAVQDKNPNAPYELYSANAGVKVGNQNLVVEAAKSRGSATNAQVDLPATDPAAVLDTLSGDAQRLEFSHKSDNYAVRAYANHVDKQFSNPSAGVVAGTAQVGAEVQAQASKKLVARAQATRQLDLQTDATRAMVRLGADLKVSEKTSITAGVRRVEEHGTLSALTQQGLGCNPTPGSSFGTGATGGVGTGANSNVLNLNQSALCSTVPASGTTDDLNATTAELGITVKPTDRTTLSAQVDVGHSNQSDETARRAQVGAAYQVSERTQVFARAETQRGLASPYSVDNTTQSASVVAGIDSTYMTGGTVYGEFRSQDTNDTQTQQLASGVRNVWHLKPGLSLSTGLERLSILSGNGQNATAATLGLDYAAQDLWRAGGKLEWRRLDGGSGSVLTQVGQVTRQDTWLSTLSAARKLDANWTALGRNYYLATDNFGDAPNGWQDRVQLGMAYRPSNQNRFDALGKLEYQVENNINGGDDWRRATIGALQTNYHPVSNAWLSTRLAAKHVDEKFPTSEGGGSNSYSAWLLGGRLIYDINELWDVGALASVMVGTGDTSGTQTAYGLELGRRMAKNLWLSVGYNWSGFTDADLTTEHTAQGAYMRLRFKFDSQFLDGLVSNGNTASEDTTPTQPTAKSGNKPSW